MCNSSTDRPNVALHICTAVFTQSNRYFSVRLSRLRPSAIPQKAPLSDNLTGSRCRPIATDRRHMRAACERLIWNELECQGKQNTSCAHEGENGKDRREPNEMPNVGMDKKDGERLIRLVPHDLRGHAIRFVYASEHESFTLVRSTHHHLHTKHPFMIDADAAIRTNISLAARTVFTSANQP
ncbi:unnamed protein product [Toxocara canis]|uniref:Uncharacterized protein n=1 Tax=Toxocara canis TaxID=6265 RepID=A0A183TW09_TOXCA|nr:unnamed protein product [Toxocara canis]